MANTPLMRLACWAALVAFTVILVRTAWLCDDAYISFRTVHNFVSGDGLRWNLAERVQAYTHPLWVLVLSAAHAITGDFYYTTVFFSIVLSVAAAALVAFRAVPSLMAGMTLVIVLASSQGYVDFSTSGLENPLTHLLLTGMLVVYLGTVDFNWRSLFLISIVAGLCATNRLDTVFLTGPMLVYALVRNRTRRGLWAVVAGFAPVMAWELFSVGYYGFPFPNTAYAKLPAAIDWTSRVEKGLAFLASCAQWDRVAALVIPTGIVAPVVLRRWEFVPLSCGSLFYLVYVVWAGGDFMAGRFLTAPLLLSLVATLQVLPWPHRAWALSPAAAAIALGLSLGARSPLVAGADYGTAWHWRKNIDPRGIADERAIYYKITGLLRADGRFEKPWNAWFEIGSKVEPGGVKTTKSAGFMAFAAPRDAYFIDLVGLGDPLLARLPPKNLSHWRPGHLNRSVPDGYRETRKTGTIQLRNPWLATYFRELALITAGPLGSWRRARAIWNLNTGAADHLLQRYAEDAAPGSPLEKRRRSGQK